MRNIKALILTGGLGTRLRPFTCSTPKPLLPVVNQPFIRYQLLELKRHGVRDVVLATGYRPGDFRRLLGDGKSLGMRIRYAHERRPLGTGGAVRNAAKWLGERAVILNGDVLQSLDLPAMLAAHERAGAEATIALARVKDPTRFGLVETDASGRIRRFLEKPSLDEVTTDTINAGSYLFERSVLDALPSEEPYSLERGLFPKLLEEGRRLAGFVQQGYWLDFGTLDKYLQVHLDILNAVAPFAPQGFRRSGSLLSAPGARMSRQARHEGPGYVALGASSTIAAGVALRGSVCVGDRCRIERDAALEDCVVLSGTRVGAGARLTRCIVGRRCRVGRAAVIGPGRALGDGSSLADYSQM